MADFYVKQHDTAPPIQVPLPDVTQVSGALNLTGCTVAFIMRAVQGTVPKVNSAAIVINAVGGIVQYQWVSPDTDTAGDYQAEFQVTFANGTKQTFPDPNYLLITITPDLDNA